jgi:Cys-tRNA(Pro) deacylase
VTDASLPEPAARVVAALEAAEVPYRLIRHGPVASLAEAAIARGVEPADVVKTLVVRVADDDFVLVLVPGDRTLHWPSLRTLLGASRLSLPDADQAKHATGFERGTITPFGSTTQWPVVADERLQGRTITLGAGVHGLAIGVPADAAVAALDAVVADVTKPS